MALTFKRIDSTKSMVDALYELLKMRHHSISHTIMPSYEEHKQFVLNHPYRSWYLIENNGQICGQVYLQNNNSIGINCLDDKFVGRFTIEIVEFIKANYTPLPSQKSLVVNRFHINVPSTNTSMQQALDEGGYTASQVTYFVD